MSWSRESVQERWICGSRNHLNTKLVQRNCRGLQSIAELGGRVPLLYRALIRNPGLPFNTPLHQLVIQRAYDKESNYIKEFKSVKRGCQNLSASRKFLTESGLIAVEQSDTLIGFSESPLRSCRREVSWQHPTMWGWISSMLIVTPGSHFATARSFFIESQQSSIPGCYQRHSSSAEVTNLLNGFDLPGIVTQRPPHIPAR